MNEQNLYMSLQKTLLHWQYSINVLNNKGIIFFKLLISRIQAKKHQIAMEYAQHITVV